MPGLIEGAHLGRGLGCSFCGTLSGRGCWFTLWMCRMPRDGRTAVEDFKVINQELASFGKDGEHPLPGSR